MHPARPPAASLAAVVRVLGGALLVAGALAGAPGAAAMQFTLVNPCAPGQAGAGCAPRILGTGAITDDDAQTLKAMAALWGKMGHTSFSGVTLVSNGGSVVGGVQLGREIRRLGLKAIAASQLQAWDSKAKAMRTVVSPAVCYSSCVYAFAGGVRREVSEGAALGVHQFSSVRPVGARSLESDAQLTAVFLRAYLIEMGVSADLLDLAMATPAREMRVLTRPEMVSLRLHSAEQPPPAWQVVVTAGGQPILRAEREISPGRTAYVSFASASDALVVHVAVRLSQQALAAASRMQLPIGQAPRLMLSMGGQRLRLAPVMPWTQRVDKGDSLLEAVGVLEQGQLSPLLQAAGGVHVADELFAGAPLSGVGLSGADLGTQGLADGLKLLLRTR